ncbi:MAG: alpha-L-arabinofuranosidase C-terminal domain-containing protein [Fimbriimonadaceae bacterium]
MKPARATLHADPRFAVGPIDRRIYGGFLEHMGRAVYGGVYDPESPFADADGFRTDVAEVLRRMNMPIVRYPGGNFVSHYDWRDGIGPREQRPVRPDFAWKSIETNAFGVDEYMRWCRLVEAEPMLAVNLGTGDAKRAAELVEYCNLPRGTYWADRRPADRPYGVKVWCLGNEMDGPWQAGHVPAEVYAQRADQASKLMKGLDDRIETVLCGSCSRDLPTFGKWDLTVLDTCWDTVDYLSAHRYSGNRNDDTHEFLGEGVLIERILEDYRSLVGAVRGSRRSRKQIFLAFDEWNVWYKAMQTDGGWTVAPHLIEEVYNLEDALVCAQFLTAFVRNADFVKIACLAQVANVIGPVLTKKDDLLVQSIAHSISMIAPTLRGVSLKPAVEAPLLRAGRHGDVPVLDAAVAFDSASGEVSVATVNRSCEQPLEVAFTWRASAAVSAVSMGGQDPKAFNDWSAKDRVVPGPLEVEVGDVCRWTVPAPGLAVVRLRA